MPRVREPWPRRLRHLWRRSRLARRGLPLTLERLDAYARLTRINRPIGTFLLLWPTLWALWIAAGGRPSLHLVLVFVLGTFLTRSAGVAINDTADRRIDPHVARTVGRPLATGEVTPREALAVAAVLLLAAFTLVLTTNRFTVLLSLAAIPIMAVYPFMKRHTYMPQFVLGVAFSWGIPMAYAAQLNHLTRITWLLFIANLLWTVIFDTIYAMVDREYDLKIGMKSTAILFAEADRAIIDAVSDVAKKRGVPNAQIALAWVLSRPGVTAPIIGASKMNHLDDAVAALDITLTEDEVKALEAPYQPKSIRGHV